MQDEVFPLRFERAPAAGLTGNARPVLAEVAALAQRFAASGAGGAVDLVAMPLSPADVDWLRGTLGRGEVSAVIEAAGASSVEETAFAGVWWVTHRNPLGEVVAELIEVAAVPAIVAAAREDAAAGAARLAAIVAAPAAEAHA